MKAVFIVLAAILAAGCATASAPRGGPADCADNRPPVAVISVR